MSYKSIAAQKSFVFALKIVEVYQDLNENKREYVLSKQLLKSGTSIGANIREAINAQTKKDFLSKIYIALKEANETLYWLDLLNESKLLSTSYYYLISDCKELYKILASTVITTKEALTKK